MDAADAAAGVAGPGAATAVPVAARRGWRDPRVRKVVQVVVSAALVVGIFWYVLQQFADLSEVWAAIQTLTWLEVAWLVVAAAWNLFTYWVLMVIATPGSGTRRRWCSPSRRRRWPTRCPRAAQSASA